MNKLIKLTTQALNGNTIETVSARELHMFLESKQDFSTWIKNRISEYDFVENQDFVKLHKKMELSKTGQVGVEYYITLDMAKELSMVERNDKGKQARKYFIECEKALRNNLPKTYVEALEAHLKSEKEKLLLQNELVTTNQRKKEISGKLGGTTKELNKVKTLNGASKNGATINKVKSVTGIKYKWQPLQSWCDENDVIPMQTTVNDYDTVTVKIYPA